VVARWLRRIALAVLVLSPLSANAAGLAPRSVQVGSSAQSAVTSYTFNATAATTANIQSIKLEICGAATGACALPTGVVTTGTVLTAQTPAGFTLDSTTNGSPLLTRPPLNIMAGDLMSFTIAGITNPDTANQTYYVRITTYTGADGVTGPVDTGTVALSTAEPVQLAGVTPEILDFCVGTSIGGNCTTVSGNAIDFGDFSPTATRTGTSVMQAQTNAANGYVITVTGTTLASGVNTIAGLGAQSSSTLGVSQFGLNLRANGVPAVGANPSGAGSGTYTGNFGIVNQYRFNSGDVVASAALPTDANTFTSSYIVNIGGSQAAGVYTSTMTYICTASF
jgi:hypothetical protein